MPDDSLLNLHAVLPRSRVNGPGTRLVVFFQGCTRGCAGCFNPETHPVEPKLIYGVSDLLDRFLDGAAGGLTVSGGEPFLQPIGLFELLRAARMRGLSTVVYTGFTSEEIKAGPYVRCLEYTDVLIDGGYDETRKEPTLLARGSTNQRFHFLSGRYGISDFYMPARSEVVIGKDGAVTGTGFSRILFTP